MKKIALAILATGTLALATPALAEGVYVGAGPVGVGVGVDTGPHYYGERHVYRDYDRGYRAYGADVSRCHTVVIRNEFGDRKRITRCR